MGQACMRPQATARDLRGLKRMERRKQRKEALLKQQQQQAQAATIQQNQDDNNIFKLQIRQFQQTPQQAAESDDISEHSLGTSSLLYTKQKYGHKKAPEIVVDGSPQKDDEVVDLRDLSLPSHYNQIMMSQDSNRRLQCLIEGSEGGPISFAPNTNYYKINQDLIMPMSFGITGDQQEQQAQSKVNYSHRKQNSFQSSLQGDFTRNGSQTKSLISNISRNPFNEINQSS